MNPVIEDLYQFGKVNKEYYSSYKNIMVDSIGWRWYALSWKFKYFVRLLVWKTIGG